MKRFISIMLCAAMLLSLSVAAFAESGEILTMKMDRNGRSVYYEDGSRAPYSVWEEVMEQFHWLRDEHGVNWDLFSYEEMTFEMDDSGHVYITKGLEGSFVPQVSDYTIVERG